MAIIGVHALLYTSEPEAVREILDATVKELRGKGVEVRGDPEDEGFGITTTLVLPGGLEVMLYEPRHKTAI